MLVFKYMCELNLIYLILTIYLCLSYWQYMTMHYAFKLNFIIKLRNCRLGGSISNASADQLVGGFTSPPLWTTLDT